MPLALTNFSSKTDPGVESYVDTNLPVDERRLKVQNNLCGVKFVVTFKSDQTECNEYGSTFSQQEVGRLCDFNARRIYFTTATERSICKFPAACYGEDSLQAILKLRKNSFAALAVTDFALSK